MINIETYGSCGFEFYTIVCRKPSKPMINQVMDLDPFPIENLRPPTQYSIMQKSDILIFTIVKLRHGQLK